MPTKTIDLDTSSANFLKFDTNTLVIDESNNRVGIGVTSPSTQFHLEGAGPYIRSKNTSADTDEKAWDFNAGTDGKFRFRSVNDAGSESNNWLQVDRDGIDINAINFYTGNESVCMKMDSSGNVGIGKTPSTWLLDVDSTGVEVASFDGSNNTGIVINSSSGESDIIGYSNSASTYNRINIRGAGGTGLVVDTSNNVGIGGAPSARLHLYGSEAEKFRIERTTDGNSTMGWKNTNDSWYAGITNTQNFSISQNADIGSGTEFVIKDETGHVGIGVIPDQELHIKDATGHCNVLIESVTDSAQLFLDSNTDGAGTASSEIYFKDNGDIKWRLRKPDTNRFQIYDEAREDASLEIVGNGDMELMPSGGNVGIGASPSCKLEVNGIMTSKGGANLSPDGDGVISVTHNFHMIDNVAGDVTINGISGGVAGMVVWFVPTDSGNNVTFKDAGGGDPQVLGSEEMQTAGSVDQTLDNSHDSIGFICVGGGGWAQIAISNTN